MSWRTLFWSLERTNTPNRRRGSPRTPLTRISAILMRAPLSLLAISSANENQNSWGRRPSEFNLTSTQLCKRCLFRLTHRRSPLRKDTSLSIRITRRTTTRSRLLESFWSQARLPPCCRAPPGCSRRASSRPSCSSTPLWTNQRGVSHPWQTLFNKSEKSSSVDQSIIIFLFI